MNSDHFTVPESTKNDGDMSKGYRSQLKKAPTGKSEINGSIKIMIILHYSPWIKEENMKPY